MEYGYDGAQQDLGIYGPLPIQLQDVPELDEAESLLPENYTRFLCEGIKELKKGVRSGRLPAFAAAGEAKRPAEPTADEATSSQHLPPSNQFPFHAVCTALLDPSFQTPCTAFSLLDLPPLQAWATSRGGEKAKSASSNSSAQNRGAAVDAARRVSQKFRHRVLQGNVKLGQQTEDDLVLEAVGGDATKVPAYPQFLDIHNPPQLHPCIRVFKVCNFGNECRYARHRFDACVHCIKQRCVFHHPNENEPPWDEMVENYKKELKRVKKERQRLIEVAEKATSRSVEEIDAPEDVSSDEVARRAAVELVLRHLAALPSRPVRLEEGFDVGAFVTCLILSVDRSALLTEYKYLSNDGGNTLPRVVSSSALVLAPRPQKTLELLEAIGTREYLTRPEENAVEGELRSLLSHVSYESRRQQQDYWDVRGVSTFKPTSAVREARRFVGTCLTAFSEFCPKGTIEDCKRENILMNACEKVHFHRLIFPHTDIELGDCSYLDTCRRMNVCKYVHYQMIPSKELEDRHRQAVDDRLRSGRPLPTPEERARATVLTSAYTVDPAALAIGLPNAHWQNDYQHEDGSIKPLPAGMTVKSWTDAQWVRCDIRQLQMSILGHFDVIMADPPWDIHMELPYGTMTDDEMRSMGIGPLSENGLIFLWVTGRAMELGRECLELWGYKIAGEIVWVKTNQLQRIIRTGRTGHWLNHSKEHCLIGVKGKPRMARGWDTDILVCDVRETSRKPDEIYSMIERICPDGRKLEIFARNHNVHQGWVGLGNQLEGIQIKEPWCLEQYNHWVRNQRLRMEAANAEKQQDDERGKAKKQRIS